MKIAIIGSGMIAKIFAIRAKELNIVSYCFSWDENDVACDHVDFFYKINIFDTDQISKICEEQGISGVIPTTELTIFPAAKIAHNINAISNPLDVAENITNKFWVREKSKELMHIKHPDFSFYTSGEYPEIKKYPVIVKPIAAGGKRGVNVVKHQEELSDAINAALDFSRIEGVLIEQYLEGGEEYSVESISDFGKHYVIQVTQKDTSGAPRCNELGHHQPAKIDSNIRKKVEIGIAELLDAVGIMNGPCHTEIKIIDGNIYLIELNARPGGDHITYPLTELSTGYPFVTGIIMNSLNEFSKYIPNNLESNYCGVYFYTEETKYLKNVFENCDNKKWLYKKNQVCEGPSKILYNDGDNLNYFIYYGLNDKLNINGEIDI